MIRPSCNACRHGEPEGMSAILCRRVDRVAMAEELGDGSPTWCPGFERDEPPLRVARSTPSRHPRPLVYLAHPVRPEGAEMIEGNLAAVERWLRLLISVELPWDVVCPWLAELRAWGEDLARAEREQRDRGMARNLRLARRCDGILLLGPRVSSGMADERDAVVESGGFVCGMIGASSDALAEVAKRGNLSRVLEEHATWP